MSTSWVLIDYEVIDCTLHSLPFIFKEQYSVGKLHTLLTSSVLSSVSQTVSQLDTNWFIGQGQGAIQPNIKLGVCIILSLLYYIILL